MQYQRFGERYQVRLERGDELMASLTQLADRERITFGALSGLGAVSSITLAYFNVDSREYEKHELDEQLEITSLIGNLALRDGKPFAHVHANVGRRDLSVLGGHVFAAVASPTLEIWLRPEDAEVVRLPDEESGLALLSLPERL